MQKKNLGIRDIAKLAGVSVATVSRVINSPELTSEEVRKKVNAIIEEYNYVPNIVAKNLYNKKSISFALFVFDMENPFFISLIKELHRIAFKNGHTLLIFDTESNPEREREYLLYCEAIRTKGIILTEGFDDPTIMQKKINQNIVFLDRKVNPNYTTVKSNNKAGVSMLIDYLYNLNHRLFGFAGYGDNIASTLERKDAFIEALQEKGIEVDPKYIFKGPVTPLTGVQALDYFCSMKNPPTAVVCGNDQVARGFITRASKLGLSVPGDFSVVGFDGCNSDYFYPKLTTIKQDIPKISEALYNSVFSDNTTPREYIIDVSFVMGDTCRKL